jgi:glycosyltransferase involved in cell wall biosynthesis
MNIQWQCVNYYPSSGGIVSYVNNVSKKLIETGNKPTVICAQLEKTLPIFETHENINIIRHPYYKINWLPINILAPIYYGIRLEKFLSKNTNDYDVIWSNFFLEAFASCNVFRKKKPIIFIIHAVASKLIKLYNKYPNANDFLKSYVRNLYQQYYLMEKKAVKECNKIVTLSKMRAKEICDFYNIDNNKLVVIPPGINIKRFSPSKRDINLLKELNLPKNCKIILSVCRLSFEKNIETLIKALKQISNENIFLIIVGKGDQKRYLEELVKRLNLTKNVIFTGERTDVERFYSIADLFVLPSIYEGFGLVYLEAMASGIPCIGLKPDYPKIIVGSNEVIDDGITGFLADPYSLDSLVEKIDRVLSDDELKRKLGNNGRKVCEKRFKWEKTAEKLLIESEKIV